MSDTNYINTYVNLVVETVHNYLNEILQLKTQITLVNNLVSEKDQVIAHLTEQIKNLTEERERNSHDEGEMQKLRDNAASWEYNYNNMVNKVSHMDTLTNQFNDLKAKYLEKEKEIDELSQQISDMKSLDKVKTKLNKVEINPKKEINKKDIVPIIKKQKEIGDDF